MSSALHNKPLAPTRPKESAPEVLSYRQRLYDRETLMLPNEPWNPAARLAQMRHNYDRLVLELGVSPRGGPKPPSGTASGGDVLLPQLPKVPHSRHWEQRDAKGSSSGAQSARRAGHRTRTRDDRGPLTTARMLQKVDALAEAGQLNVTQAKRLRKLWSLQEQVLARAAGGGGGSSEQDEELLNAFQSVLAYMDEPGMYDAEPAAPSKPAPVQPSTAATAQAPRPPAEHAAAAAGGGGSTTEDASSQAEAAKAAAIDSEQQRKSTANSAAGSRSDVDKEAEAAFAKVQDFVSSGYSKVFELFQKMDANLDGKISRDELHDGFFGLGLEMSRAECDAFFRRVESSTAEVTSLKSLHRALRPGVSMKTMLQRPEDKAREAGGDIRLSDMTTDGMTEQEAAEARTEAQLRAGRLPSLSPDEDDDSGGKKPKVGASVTAVQEYEYVWNQLQSRIAPDGLQAAPLWQRETLHRVQWRVDCNRRNELREKREHRKATHPFVPSWDRPPAGSAKRNILDRELRKQADRAAKPTMETEASMGASSTRGGMSATSRCVDLGATSELPAASVPNASRLALDAANPDETSTAHLAWLRQSAISFDEATTSRANTLSLIQQDLQLLSLHKQELDQGLEKTRKDIDATQRSGKAPAIELTNRRDNMRRERLKEDLLEVQTKANKMASSTQALMHVINSLRITRKRHVQRIRGLDAKERTMDNDAQFLLGSASAAMEERERLKAKHERLKHEAAAWRNMQLKEASSLDEDLASLDAEHRELDGRLQALDEKEKRDEYEASRQAVTEAQRRHTKKGYLQGQVDGLEAEFARIIKVSIKETKPQPRDQAVKDIIKEYSSNELRNKSCFQFVSEELGQQKEALEAEVAELEAQAAALEAEQHSQDTAASIAQATATVAHEAYAAFEKQLEQHSRTVEKLLPLVERLGSAIDVELPQHLEGSALQPNAIPTFLALLEDRLHDLLNSAASIVAAREPPPPEESDDGQGSERERSRSLPMEPEEEDVSAALATLRAVMKPKTLVSAKGTKILHNDSSERLLPV